MSRSLFVLISSIAAAGCLAQPPTSFETDSLIGNTKFASLTVVGALAYGNTSSAVAYTSSPTYRGFSFTGAVGDQVDVKVSSANGDAIGWLIDGSYHIVAQNDDTSDASTDSHLTATLASAGTFYVIFRELNLKSATLTVTLACAGGTCANTCTPGALRCSGLQPQTCSPSKTWQNTGSACPYVCSAGECTGVCVPGSTECASSTATGTCDATGEWVTSTCANGYTCANGACSCAPASCGSRECGSVVSACGTVANCGTCADGLICRNGSCVVLPGGCPCGGTAPHCEICQ
jgi:hypothetical protein